MSINLHISDKSVNFAPENVTKTKKDYQLKNNY